MQRPGENFTGLVHDLPIETYHDDPTAVSKSGLDDINHSPAFYWGTHLDPKRPKERKESAGQLVGNMAHCAVLEPLRFRERYVVGPDVNKNTNAWKDFCKSLPPGSQAVDAESRDMALAMRESVLKLPDVADALKVGAPEVSAYWIDEETGARCRCRPDWAHPVNTDSVILFDVKTYKDASDDAFVRQLVNMRYDVQDAYYTDGYQKASGLKVLAFVFVVIETSYPYLANAIMLEEGSREAGRRKYRRDLNTYAECSVFNKWPGYGTGIKLIQLPPWAKE